MKKTLIVVAVVAAIAPTSVIGVAQATTFGAQAGEGEGKTPTLTVRARRFGKVLFAKGTLKAGAGVSQSLLATTRRRDGRRQVTYNGWPLY